MKAIKLFFFFVILLGLAKAQAQDRYWVQFTDKEGSSFNPYEYFDIKAIERRLSQDLPLNDITDYPLNQEYTQQVSSIAIQTGHQSRWFNMLAVSATPEQIDLINHLSFVKDIIPITSEMVPAKKKYNTSLNRGQEILLREQLEVMQGPLFDSAGFDGTGIRIAVFDIGFISVDKNPVFKHIRDSNKIIATWDFTEDEAYVYRGGTHGTNVLSNIAGQIDGRKLGLAINAEFLLARTEVKSEPFSEEENWLAASEWADKNGAHIINSSLGYTKDRYFPEQMNGSSFVSRAATLAARKGILVVNAMGNDGNGKWKYISAPADADSILSIGGIDPDLLYHINFSSYGPTADHRRKPNVAAFGKVIVGGPKGLSVSHGTSFSTPLVTGFAACAWQSRPSLSNMEMLEEIEKSGQFYPYYDYAHGYGIPQASHFVNVSQEDAIKTFEMIECEEMIKIKIDNALIERNGNPHLYYHIENSNGTLEQYYVIEVDNEMVYEIPRHSIQEDQILRIYYKGYRKEIIF